MENNIENNNESKVMHCSWADAYLKKRKYKKIIKTSFVLGLASIITAGMSAIIATGFKNKCNNVLDQYGYDKANDLYKQEATLELTEELSNDKITYKEYEEKISKMKDIDKEEFLKQNASEKDLKEYQSSDVGHGIGTWTALSSAMVGIISFGVGAGLGAKMRDEENEKNAREARISRILHR